MVHEGWSFFSLTRNSIPQGPCVSRIDLVTHKSLGYDIRQIRHYTVYGHLFRATS
jgi:hypothetical protein